MALSADARVKTRNRQGYKFAEYTVATGAVVYVGALLNFVTSTGRVTPGTAATGRKFAGLAEEAGTGNTAGTVTVRVSWGYEALIDAAAALTTAYVGSNAAITSDNQLTTMSGAGTTAVRVRVGRISQIESGDVWVDLCNFSESDV